MSNRVKPWSREGCNTICCSNYINIIYKKQLCAFYKRCNYNRRKFRSEASDNMDRWKAEMERVREKTRVEERRAEERISEKRKNQKKEDAGARKGKKIAKHCVFLMIWGSGGSKSRLAKAAGAEPAGQMRDEKVHTVVARSTFPSQNVQNTSASDHFWKLRCRKMHAIVARSTCASEKAESTSRSDHFWKLRCRKSARCCGVKHISKSNVQNTPRSDHFWKLRCRKSGTPLWRESTFPIQNVQSTPLSDHFLKLRCRKSARCCGAKHISKSKCTKHTMYGPLLEVQMSKECTPLWREAHFEVKMLKTHKNTRVSDHFWRFRCRFASLHYITLHYTPLHCTTLHYTTLQLQLHNYTPLH